MMSIKEMENFWVSLAVAIGIASLNRDDSNTFPSHTGRKQEERTNMILLRPLEFPEEVEYSVLQPKFI